MNIASFIISLLTGLISFLQGGCATGIGAIGSGIGGRVGGYEGARIAREGASIGDAGFLVVLAALIGIIGGSFALPRKKASYILLSISVFFCFLALAISEGAYKDAWVWMFAYVIAAVCAYAGCEYNQSGIKVLNVSDSPVTSNQASTNITETVKNIFNPSPAQPVNQNLNTEKVYEPVIGLETNALIKRAFLFLEDGEFDNAGRYLNQALNQDAEDARVHFGQLMCVRKAHNPLELVNNLPTLLENEKLFQRALRFADDDYKKQLEELAQASRDKLEQKRLAEEAERERQLAEQERKRAEQEAEKERRYQEILALREKATSMNELNALRWRVSNLRPYKDTEQIYNEVN